MMQGDVPKILAKTDNKQKNGTYHKLGTEEKKQVIEWCATGMYSDQQIADKVNEKFNISISRKAIWQFRNSPRRKQLIERLQEKVNKEILKKAVCRVEGRIVILEEILKDAMREKPIGSDKYGNIVYGVDHRVAIKALIEIRKELKDETRGAYNAKRYNKENEKERELGIKNKSIEELSKLLIDGFRN